MTARVLLAHSMFWPNIGRLAVAFRKAGFLVDAIAPAGHPVHRMISPSCTFKYRPTNAYRSIREAIDASEPDLVVPCDDRVVGHLHRLYKETSAARDSSGLRMIASLIETSLGSPLSFDVVTRRSYLTDLAQLPDVHIPETAQIDSLGELLDWVKRHGLPAVLKLDGSFGGRDVIMIRTEAELARGFLRMELRRSLIWRIRLLLFERDAEPIFSAGRFQTAAICVQSYVPGDLANCAIACWQGEVLASRAVEVLQRGSDFGIATVVRRVNGEQMIATARSIARHLRLSGFCGFDFVIDQDSGQTKLIEINPRATQINHFPGHHSPTLPEALFAALSNKKVFSSSDDWLSEEVALFPQEWKRDPASQWLSKAFHDVPSEEPALLRYFASDMNFVPL